VLTVVFQTFKKAGMRIEREMRITMASGDVLGVRQSGLLLPDLTGECNRSVKYTYSQYSYRELGVSAVPSWIRSLDALPHLTAVVNHANDSVQHVHILVLSTVTLVPARPV